jgi:immune inhibitor A
VIIHAGRGAEETAAKGEIWSHKWVLPKQFNADGTKIYAYLTVPEDCKLGVCAHELGHLLFGFPDLYDDDYSSEGIGDWCLMAGGSWNNQGLTPAHPCAWCKKQQDWVQVINQSTNQKAVTINDVQSGKSVYRLWKDGGPGKEYFLIENRQQKKYDTFIPGSGLLVWHVDDQIDGNSNEFHYKVALVQADGKKDLEQGNNRGDTSDCWPGKLNKKSIDSKTNPNTLSYGGIDSGVKLANIRMDKTGIVKADIYVSKDPVAPKKKTQKNAAKKKKAGVVKRQR